MPPIRQSRHSSQQPRGTVTDVRHPRLAKPGHGLKCSVTGFESLSIDIEHTGRVGRCHFADGDADSFSREIIHRIHMQFMEYSTV